LPRRLPGALSTGWKPIARQHLTGHVAAQPSQRAPPRSQGQENGVRFLHLRLPDQGIGHLPHAGQDRFDPHVEGGSDRLRWKCQISAHRGINKEQFPA
jgi:hypothetical protein